MTNCPACFVSNETLATEHTTDRAKDTSLPRVQRNAQINLNRVCTIPFHLSHSKLILTDDGDDDDDDDNEGCSSRGYNSFAFPVIIFGFYFFTEFARSHTLKFEFQCSHIRHSQ